MGYQAVWVDFGLMVVGAICVFQLNRLRKKIKKIEGN